MLAGFSFFRVLLLHVVDRLKATQARRLTQESTRDLPDSARGKMERRGNQPRFHVRRGHSHRKQAELSLRLGTGFPLLALRRVVEPCGDIGDSAACFVDHFDGDEV